MGGELQVPLVKICKSIPDVDVYVLVTDRNINAPAFDYADEYSVIDATDKDGILKYAKEKNIDGILTTSEIGLFTVAYVCKEMGLPGPSYISAQISNNKHLMRERMKQAGMVIPKCFCIHGLEELMKESCELSFPLVIKPTDVSGSIGVMFVESQEELLDSCRKALELSNNSEVILEEYLIGKEYSVETLGSSGVMVGKKCHQPQCLC
ncbi:MAG: ATP-grasp domain-containing protein [Prevotella sp.]|nr:ATP-grasp domain-containing protein [Prevotella sp.]